MRSALSLAAVLAVSTAPPARADVQDDRDLCGSSKPEVAIPNCTKVIKDRSQPPAVRALALSNRGFASQSIGEVDDAISDYNAAIKLVLGAGLGRHGSSAMLLAKTYVNRGVAHGMRNNPTQALSDYDAALALDPGLDSARYNRAMLLPRQRPGNRAASRPPILGCTHVESPGVRTSEYRLSPSQADSGGSG